MNRIQEIVEDWRNEQLAAHEFRTEQELAIDLICAKQKPYPSVEEVHADQRLKAARG